MGRELITLSVTDFCSVKNKLEDLILWPKFSNYYCIKKIYFFQKHIFLNLQFCSRCSRSNRTEQKGKYSAAQSICI